MYITITYNELSELVYNKFNVRPKFITIDERTFEVGYKPSIFMPNVCIQFHIEMINKNNVCLSYECSVPTSLMIAGIVAYIKEKLPSGVEVNTIDKYINIYPQRFKQVEKVLEFVTLSNITFAGENINVELKII